MTNVILMMNAMRMNTTMMNVLITITMIVISVAPLEWESESNERAPMQSAGGDKMSKCQNAKMHKMWSLLVTQICHFLALNA